VREAARCAGVSSGAPFRHFPDKTALMTAVAEAAMRRCRAEVERAADEARDDPPLEQLRALGAAYLQWALRNPAQFKVAAEHAPIDVEGSATLRAFDTGIQNRMEAVLLAARQAGQLQDGDLCDLQLGALAMVHGLARMAVDGRPFQRNAAPADAETRLLAALDQYVEGLARAEGR